MYTVGGLCTTGWGEWVPALGYVFIVMGVFVGYLWVSSLEGILLARDWGSWWHSEKVNRICG